MRFEAFNVKDMPASKDLQTFGVTFVIHAIVIIHIFTGLFLIQECVYASLALSAVSLSQQNSKASLPRKLRKDLAIHILYGVVRIAEDYLLQVLVSKHLQNHISHVREVKRISYC